MLVNVGSTDRLVRLIAGVVLLLVAIFAVKGVLAWVLGILGVVMLATGTLRFCPLYLSFKISTNK